MLVVSDYSRVFSFSFFQRPRVALEVRLLQSPMTNQAPFLLRQVQVCATMGLSGLLLLRKIQMLMLMLLLHGLSSVPAAWLWPWPHETFSSFAFVFSFSCLGLEQSMDERFGV